MHPYVVTSVLLNYLLLFCFHFLNIKKLVTMSYWLNYTLEALHICLLHVWIYLAWRIICGNRDPHWTNNEIKKLIIKKNFGHKSYCCFNRDLLLFEKFKVMQNQLNMSIENSKQMHYSKLSRKMYWSILETFLNNKNIPFNSSVSWK